ncbi:unnamed protein product, partial [Meganyctiphanes norvegica]
MTAVHIHKGITKKFTPLQSVSGEHIMFLKDILNYISANCYDDGEIDQALMDRSQKTKALGPAYVNATNPDAHEDPDDPSGKFDFEGENLINANAQPANVTAHTGENLINAIAQSANDNDVLAILYRHAVSHGAEVLEGRGESSKKKNAIHFVGTGFKLGQTESDHQEIPDSRLPEDKPRDVMLRMWKTGFTVDGGELRPYEDPGNAEFLTSIRRSEVPQELIREARGGEVYINMADHRHEDYVPKKKNRPAFGGSGHTLGSVTPAVVGQETRPAGASGGAAGATAVAGDPKLLEKKAQEQVGLDASQPTTNIQVRLPDGSRVVLKLNHTHTVGSIRQFIRTARPSHSVAPFALMTTFPYAELSNDSQNVAEAKLLNAAIVVKPKI